MADEKQSVIGPQLTVQGTVSGAEDLVVEGRVEGRVQIQGSLTVEAGGTVEGDVEATEVVAGGDVNGDVLAAGTVTVRAGARLRGDLRCAAVVVEDGGTFDGTVDAEVELPDDVAAAR